MHDHAREMDLQVMEAAEQISAGGNGTGLDISGYIGTLAVHLNAENESGTNPTLDVHIEESDDNSTYTDVTDGAFAQVTDAAAADEKLVLDTRALKKYIRAVDALGGTSPVFNRAIALMGRKQVGAS